MYIQKSSFFIDLPNVFIKAKRKLILAAAWTSKKLKGHDDPVLAEKFHIIATQDAGLVDSDKANIATKTQIKKAADVEKKALEKIKKIKEKEKFKLKKEVLRMRKLAAFNHKAQIIFFIALLSDLSTVNNICPYLIEGTPAISFFFLFSTTPVVAAHLACQIGL